MRVIKNAIVFISFFAFCQCIANEGNHSFESLFLLPLSFAFLSVLFSNVFARLQNSTVFYVFLFQAIIRYDLLPVMMSRPNYDGIGSDSKNGNYAIFFMLLELVLCFLVLNFFSLKQRRTYLDQNRKFVLLKPTFIFLAMVLGMGAYIYLTGYFGNVSLVWNLGAYIKERLSSNNLEQKQFGYGGILFMPFRILIALLLISYVKLSKRIKESQKLVLYLIIIIGASMFIEGTSRLSIVVFILPSLIVISQLIQRKYSTKFVGISIGVLIPIIIIASIGKFSNGNDSSTTLFKPAVFNAYFSGPGNLALGLDSYQNLDNKTHFLFFINDVFQNIPGFVQFTQDKFKTSQIFNKKIYGRFGPADQIVPLSTSGIFHFGLLGGFIYTGIFLSIALFFERKAFKQRNVAFRFVFISLSISLSMVFMLNIGSMYFALTAMYLFVYVPVLLGSKLNNIQK